MTDHNPALENLLTETRSFPPSDEFAAQANSTPALYEQAKADRLAFWADQAQRFLTWDKPFTEVLDFSGAPTARWFAAKRADCPPVPFASDSHRDLSCSHRSTRALARARTSGMTSSVR